MTRTEKVAAIAIVAIVGVIILLVLTASAPGGDYCDIDGVDVDQAGDPLPSGEFGYSTECARLPDDR